MNAVVKSLPYPVYDADHHIYETPDAFMRYLPEEFKEDFHYVEVGKRTKLKIAGQISEYIPNPTFAVVAGPGTHEKWYRGENPEGLSMRQIAGPAVRPPSEWYAAEERLKLMDRQGIHAALLFPTLASVIEARLNHKPETMLALFRSLNRWSADEWGFARDNRIFPVPMVSLVNIEEAVREVEYLLKAGARTIGVRPAAVPGSHGGKSPGDPAFDPFWARCEEAKIFVCLHASDSGYDSLYRMWVGGGNEYVPFQDDSFREMLDLLSRAAMDTLSALVCHGALERHPNLRVASVENGAGWVGALLKRFDRVYGMMPKAFKRHPRETFHRQVFVAPFYENDTRELATHIPVERILFGSDYPHPEGTAEPLDYIEEFKSYSAPDMKRVFHTNLRQLLEGVRD